MATKPPPEPMSPQKDGATIAVIIEAMGKAQSELAATVKAARSAASSGTSTLQMLEVLRNAKTSLESVVGLNTTLVSCEAELSNAMDREFLELDSLLRQACMQRGWTVDGQWPTLYVQRGVTLEVDTRKRSATVGGKRLASVDLVRLLAALDAQVKDLVPKDFDATKFMSQLSSAYDETVSRSDGVRQVPVYDLYRAFVVQTQTSKFWRDATKEALVETTADQFRARLSRMLETGVSTALDGRQLLLLPPLNPKEAMFVYLPSDARFGFVGRVELLARAAVEGGNG